MIVIYTIIRGIGKRHKEEIAYNIIYLALVKWEFQQLLTWWVLETKNIPGGMAW